MRAALLATLLCTGCAWERDTALGLEYLRRTVTTDDDGYVRVHLPASADKVLLRMRPTKEQHAVWVDRVEDRRGRTVRDLRQEAFARYPTAAAAPLPLSHMNWPITAEDPPLRQRDAWLVLGLWDLDPYDERAERDGMRFLAPQATIDLDLLLADDEDFSTGTLTAHMHLVGAVQQDEHYMAALDEAMRRAVDLLRAYGIELEFITSPWPEQAVGLPSYDTPEFWQALSASTDDLAIDVAFVDAIAIWSPARIAGSSGGLPLGLLPSEHSGIVISAITMAGPDLIYSDGEIDLLAMTLAHEVGHAVGLAHPVEFSYIRWDALDDTPDCDNASDCMHALGTNLMYPAPVCSSDACWPQRDLTDDQQGVMHRYTGVH